MSTKSHKLIEYTVLLLGVVVFAFLFWTYRAHNTERIIIIGATAIFYSLWGIFHHLLEKRLTLEIALEYILISFFTFLLVLIALSV